jgi:hypothetical protein
MGVERAVTRWYVLRQSILTEIETLEASLAQADENTSASEEARTDIAQQLARAREKLHLLGPCPKPMMG